MKLCRDQIKTILIIINTIHRCCKLTSSDLICVNLFVVDVDSDPLAEHQLHGGGVAELDRGFDDQVNAFVRRSDAVEVNGIVDG